MVEAFPKDPEQWIYNKAEEYKQVMNKAPTSLAVGFMSPEDREINRLKTEVACLRLAINSFNELYKKFKENQK